MDPRFPAGRQDSAMLTGSPGGPGGFSEPPAFPAPRPPPTREDDESPGSFLIALCHGRGRRGGEVIRYKTRQLFISACFAGGTEKCFPLPFAVSINILLPLGPQPDTHLGVLGDTQFDTWPLS